MNTGLSISIHAGLLPIAGPHFRLANFPYPAVMKYRAMKTISAVMLISIRNMVKFFSMTVFQVGSGA